MTVAYVYKGIGHEIDKDAAWDYIRDGYLLPPRTILKGRTKSSAFLLPDVSVKFKRIASLVQQTLESIIGDVAGAHRAVMFTGGFDSMLMASLVRHCGAEVTAVTIQFGDYNSKTVAGSMQMVNRMGIAHHILQVKEAEFLSAFETLAGLTHEPLLDLDLAVVYAALKKYDRSIAGDILISGMGSDQWFGNEALDANFGGLAARMNFQILAEEAHQLVAQTHRCRFIFPFLSKSMLALSQQIPAEMKQDKKLLRTLAMARTIPQWDIESEVQVPSLMRHVLVRTYGGRAWPCLVSVDRNCSRVNDQTLRQIILGLWLEKIKERITGL